MRWHLWPRSSPLSRLRTHGMSRSSSIRAKSGSVCSTSESSSGARHAEGFGRTSSPGWRPGASRLEARQSSSDENNVNLEYPGPVRQWCLQSAIGVRECARQELTRSRIRAKPLARRRPQKPRPEMVERQPLAVAPLESQADGRDSYAMTAVADTIDRSLHATIARFTGGQSPAALAHAHLDWLLVAGM